MEIFYSILIFIYLPGKIGNYLIISILIHQNIKK
jgi:hypothetical protein